MRARPGNRNTLPVDPERRTLLIVLGSAVSAWAGQSKKPSSTRKLQRPTPPCVVRPEQTEGPYFVDEHLNRSDIRSDSTGDFLREGVPLRLKFHVAKVVGSVCTPLPGAVVDLWHCDAQGVYSDVEDDQGRFDTRGKTFLRGFQTTDAKGNVEFLTIYPGWYSGRAVHLHFKVRTHPGSRRGFDFTSQLYFDERFTDIVHAQAPYISNGTRDTRNEDDHIYRRGGRNLMLSLVKNEDGYAGTFELGLKFGGA